MEAEDAEQIVELLQTLVEIFISQSLHVVLELSEEIRQIVDLSISELQLDQHFFDVVDVVAGVPPLDAQLSEEVGLLLRGQSI